MLTVAKQSSCLCVAKKWLCCLVLYPCFRFMLLFLLSMATLHFSHSCLFNYWLSLTHSYSITVGSNFPYPLSCTLNFTLISSSINSFTRSTARWALFFDFVKNGTILECKMSSSLSTVTSTPVYVQNASNIVCTYVCTTHKIPSNVICHSNMIIPVCLCVRIPKILFESCTISMLLWLNTAATTTQFVGDVHDSVVSTFVNFSTHDCW